MFKLGIIASAMRRVIGKLLDLYPNAAAAYSLRKLRDAYTGSAIRVRRSTDNTEQDIGFDGSGNLDETSLTTFVGNGNAFVRSEEFDNAAWIKGATTATANQTTAPDGTVTADLIAETATTATHVINSASLFQFIFGRTYTMSVYLKKGSGATAPDRMQLTFVNTAFGTGQYANFDISAGTVITQVGGTATITVAANGFYRCTFTATCTTTTSTNPTCFNFTNNANLGRQPSYLGSTTSNVYAWGAQLNAGSTATTYVATTANQAGFGYVTKWYDQSGTILNQFSYSEQFNNAYWSKNQVTATADQTTAPDGTTTADLIAESAVTNQHTVSTTSGSFTSGLYYTQSIYIKKGTGVTAPDIIQLNYTSARFGTAFCNFNISTGVAGTPTGCTVSITSVGSGWYRCSITALCTSTGTGTTIIQFCNNNIASAVRPSYLGVITSDVFIWGAQLVQGSDPLTYTKTEAANSNRDVVQTTAANQPAIVIAGAIEKIGTKASVFFDTTNDRLDTSAFIASQPNTSIVVGKQLVATNTKNIIDGITTRQYIFSNASNYIAMNAGTDLASTIAWSTIYRLVFALFNGASSTLYQNNTSIASGNAGTNALSGFRIGSTGGWNGWSSEVIIYPSDQTSNQSGIQTDINTYYTIY